MIKQLLCGGVLLLAIGCSAAGTPPPGSAPPGDPPAAPAPAPPAPAPPASAPLTAAPWAATQLTWASVPRAYRTAWEVAENRATCAPLAPAEAGSPAGSPRTAFFSGGWAVAYDLPETRSAYGVAGTGASASGATYDGFPHTLRWADGSVARYGPEGGTGPNQLAYLTIPGQTCLYNVWSRVSVAHLEDLLRSLRYVRPSP